MPDKDEKAKNELSAKDIRDYLGLACIRKIPVELLYNNNRYQCSYGKVETDYIILDFINDNDVNNFIAEPRSVTATFVFENKRYMFQSKIIYFRIGFLFGYNISRENNIEMSFSISTDDFLYNKINSSLVGCGTNGK